MPKNICPDCGSDKCKTLTVLLQEKNQLRKHSVRKEFWAPTLTDFLPVDHPLYCLPKLEDPFKDIKKYIWLASLGSIIIPMSISYALDFSKSERQEFAFLSSIALVLLTVLTFRLLLKFPPTQKLKEIAAKKIEVVARNEQIKKEYIEKLSKLWKCSSCGNVYDPN